jgi:hypothetical protein
MLGQLLKFKKALWCHNIKFRQLDEFKLTKWPWSQYVIYPIPHPSRTVIANTFIGAKLPEKLGPPPVYHAHTEETPPRRAANSW